MRHQQYITLSVLIAAKAGKKTIPIPAMPAIKAISVSKPEISKHHVTEGGAIVAMDKKWLTAIG